jgi:hypothetical protein
MRGDRCFVSAHDEFARRQCGRGDRIGEGNATHANHNHIDRRIADDMRVIGDMINVRVPLGLTHKHMTHIEHFGVAS